MNLKTARSLRSALASAAIIALLALSTGPVAAATGGTDGTYTQAGKSADMVGGHCLSNRDATTTCSSVLIFAFVGRMSDSLSGVTHVNQICVNLDRYTVLDETGELIGDYVSEYGCRVDLPSGAISFGSGLSSAVIAPLTIGIAAYVCIDKFDCTPGPSRDVTIAGTWLGTGLVSTWKYRASNSDGLCRYAESGRGSNRQATFAGSVDGQTFSEAYASLRDSKSTYRSRCIEA